MLLPEPTRFWPLAPVLPVLLPPLVPLVPPEQVLPLPVLPSELPAF
jgi:hypothetical protein